MPDPEINEHLVHLRNRVWDDRELFLDALMLHTCVARKDAAAMVWIVGWEVDTYIQAALIGDRSLLDG